MATHTVLYIILAGIIALGVSLFLYFYRSQRKGKLRIALGILRFLSVFSILLLLINPKVQELSYTTVKPVLAIAADNSASINYLNASTETEGVLERFRESEALQKRFDLDLYSFGSEIKPLDSLSFDEKQTHISKVLRSFPKIYKNREYAPVLITDGNATLGEDYRYTASANLKTSVFFVVAGDTTVYEDLKVDRINVNRYAYLGNEFPVEVLSSYSGLGSVRSELLVTRGNQVVHRETAVFNEEQNSRIFNFYLPALGTGVQQYKVRLLGDITENNINNNEKDFAVEVIDQRTEVLILYASLHPDVGTLKKAIESNRLRAVTLTNIENAEPDKFNDYDLIILFEPDRRFKKVYDQLDLLDKNRFTIAGANSEADFLNQVQDVFVLSPGNQTEEVQANKNRSFSAFRIEDVDFENFPPLEAKFGKTTIKSSHDVAFYQTINGVSTDYPLLAVTETENGRAVLLFGTGIWKWRAQTFLNEKSFEKFDDFVHRLVQYAASTEKKTRLRLNYETFYYGGSRFAVNAQYFNKNYIFDPGANVSIKLENTQTGESYQSPFVIKKNSYEVLLSNLEPGIYDFTVSVEGQQIRRSGRFTIVPYDIEKQSLNADFDKMKTVAEETGGMVVLPDEQDLLIERLLTDNRYTPVQKSSEKNVPLIDFKILLFLIAAFLAAEWFLRKYNGLI